MLVSLRACFIAIGVGFAMALSISLSRASGVRKVRRFLNRPLVTTTNDGIMPLEGKKWIEPGHVYFVSTPLGNLWDMSPRAKAVLEQVDVICAEDTRTTASLLQKLQIKYNSIISHHEHNQRTSIEQILERVSIKRQSIAVVSDAGTPAISDPGTPLARALAAAGVPIHPVPGPCAMAAALSVCGLSATPSSFFGFLPVVTKSRKAILQMLDMEPLRSHTIVFYEAPHRLLKTLRDLSNLQTCQAPRYRRLVICRELTKAHEEIVHGASVQEVLSECEKRADDGVRSIRGEFTLVLGPVYRNDDVNSKVEFDESAERSKNDSGVDDEEEPSYAESNQESNLQHPIVLDDLSSEEERTAAAKQLLEHYLSQQVRASDAARRVSKELKLPKSFVYRLSIRKDIE